MSDINHAIKLTYQEYLLLPEGERYELIEGDLYMVPSPEEPHQRFSKRLEVKLVLLLEDQDFGYVYHAPFDVVLSVHNVVQPDILFISQRSAVTSSHPRTFRAFRIW